MKKNYKLIIPSQISNDIELSSTAKLLTGEIFRLSTKEGYCFASNKYLADLMNIHETTSSKIISELKRKEIVKIFIDNNGRARRIYLQSKDWWL